MKLPQETIHRVRFGVLLTLLSIFFYVLNFAIFGTPRDIVFYLLEDTAFVFVQVLLATLILQQILNEREKRGMLKKLNMVIGAFFSEVGTPLLEYFRDFDAHAAQMSSGLSITVDWPQEGFERMRGVLAEHDYQVDSRAGDLKGLREFVISKRPFLLALPAGQSC